jgi:hypothetical protein
MGAAARGGAARRALDAGDGVQRTEHAFGRPSPELDLPGPLAHEVRPFPLAARAQQPTPAAPRAEQRSLWSSVISGASVMMLPGHR